MVEVTHLVAVLLALGAAVIGASQFLFIRIGTDEGRVYDAVFVVMLVNVIVLVPLISVIYYPDYGLTSMSWLSFIAAGVLGTLLGRVFLYTSIEKIGASRTSPIVSSNAFVATILGVVVLGESISWIRGVGIVLIVAGIAAIAWETSHENPDDLPPRELYISLLIPMGAVLAYGAEPIYASIGFAEGTPAPVGLAIKTVAATLGFTVYLHWRASVPRMRQFPRAQLKWFVLAGLANSGFLLCYYVALSLASVNVVVPIIITQTLFVVLLSAIFMPERLERVSWQLVAAATVVVVGVLMISVSV